MTEGRTSHDVLERLAPRPPRDGDRERRDDVRRDLAAEHGRGRDLTTVDAPRVREQQLGVRVRGGHARARKGRGGPAEEIARRDALAHQLPAAARRAASSASIAERTTGPRSPSSTASRLYALYPVRWSAIRFSGKL